MLNMAESNETIVKSMHQHLNQWPGKPEQLGFFLVDAFTKDPPAIMLHQLAGPQVEKQYVNGSYLGMWNFAIYLRIQPKETIMRFDAAQTLKDLTEYLTASDSTLPVLLDPSMEPLSIILTNTPVSFGEQANGATDYRTLFRLRYKQKG